MVRKLLIAIITVVTAAVLVLPAVAGHRGNGNENAGHQGTSQNEGSGESTSGRGCYPPGNGQAHGKEKSKNHDC